MAGAPFVFLSSGTHSQEAAVVAWITRILLALAASITGWFVAKDSPNFGVVQMMVATCVLALLCLIFAFWPERWSHFINRLGKSR
jgi:VIT1/CCC1 family predicted Fe2+/Mn2+ transporter